MAIVLLGVNRVKLTHALGYTIDYGNLEADYMAQGIVQEFYAWSEDCQYTSEKIVPYVAIFKPRENEKKIYQQLFSHERFIYIFP